MNSIQLTYGKNRDGSPNAIFDGINRIVCSFHPVGGDDTRKGSPTTMETMTANARLFCASPELLEALRKIEGYLYEAQSDIPEEYRAKRDVVSAMNIARLAISKATQL